MLKSNDQNTSMTDKKSWFSEDRLAYISISVHPWYGGGHGLCLDPR